MKTIIAILLFASCLLSPAYAQNWGDNDAPAPAPLSANAAVGLIDGRVTQLETQVRQLTNDVEKLQYQNTQMQGQMQRMAQDNEVRFQVIEKMQTQMQEEHQKQLQAAAAQQQAAAPVEAEKEATASTEEAPAPAGGEKDAQTLYDDGFNKLRAADYASAEKSFKQFLSGYPKHQLAGNATYWLGETYYVRGQFKEAAVTFADGYQKYPKNSKAPDNLLKLAMSLASLGSKDDACLTLGELKSKYPNAAPSIRQRGDAEKKKLGCRP